MTAVYAQQWTGSNGASWPDFTAVEGTLDIQSNSGRCLTPATAFNRAKGYYNVPGVPQDFVLTIDCTIQGGTTNDWYLELSIRGASNSYSNQWQFSSWQIQYNPSISGPQLYNVNGSGTNNFLNTFSDPGCVVGDTLHLKIAPLGTTYRIKSWKNAGSEPAYETYVDAGAPTGTRVGLGCVQGATASPALDVRFKNLAIDDGIARRNLALPQSVRRAAFY